MLSSDPIYNSSLSPAGEWEPFFGFFDDPQKVRFFPTGRLHEAPSFYTVVPSWDTIEPLPDRLVLFKDVVLKRELVVQFEPTAIIDTWILTTQPMLAYTTAHWRSRQMGNVDEVDIFNTWWYLFYGDFGAFDGVQFTEIVDQTALDYDLLSVDSGATTSTPEGDPPVMQGWNLALVHKFFTATSDIPTVTYHALASWSLHQDPLLDPYTVWEARQASRWDMVINLLDFPPNHLTLTPWQP